MISELLKILMQELRSIAQTESVVGEPIKAGDSTIVPVTRVTIGFGAGEFGSDNSVEEEKDKKMRNGAGLGGGISIDPVAFIVVTKEGKVHLAPLAAKEATISKVLDIVPEILNKFVELKGGTTKTDIVSAEQKTEEEPVEQ